MLDEVFAVMRIRKLVPLKSLGDQPPDLPHVSLGPPTLYTMSLPESVGVAFAVVHEHEVSQFHPSAISKVPAAVEPEASTFTLIPCMVLEPGIERPKPE